MATFMFPNLQFQDRTLDLKFYPSFLVLLSQVKLFMSGLSSFYRKDIYVVLLFTAASMLLLGVACVVREPCLAKKANIWFAAEYFLISWVF